MALTISEDSGYLAGVKQWKKPLRFHIISGSLKFIMHVKGSKNNLFNKWCWEIQTATYKKRKLDHQLTPFTKINSRWIKGLNVSCDTIKVLEENIGRKISDIPHSNIFTNMSPRARDIKERINKWDFIKIKSVCTAKENISKMKREPTLWAHIFASDTLRQGFDLQNI